MPILDHRKTTTVLPVTTPRNEDGHHDPDLGVILAFLRRIGIRVEIEPICPPTVLPGISVERGALVVDCSQLLDAGDLLHEAGHLAVMTSHDREGADGSLDASGGEEMMAIAWSYAAATYLRFPASFVFHDRGYRGGSKALVDNFSNGRFVGVSMLDWIGLTVDPHRSIAKTGAVYPRMIRWLRDSSDSI